MQLYQGLNIGTAKPTEEEKQNIPHHLVDVLPIQDPIDVFFYVKEATRIIDEIRARGRQPIVAGGSGMYIRALLYGLDPLPADTALRKELDERYDNETGFVELKEIMKRENPEDFNRWEKHRRKLIRAYEVFKLTGKSITFLQTTWEQTLQFPLISWTLQWERDALRRRIEERTHIMLKSGWIEEAIEMRKLGILETPTAHQVLGYKQIYAYLDGDLSYDEMEQKIIAATWRLARRQMTWFRGKHPETKMIEMPQESEALVKQMILELNNG